MKIDVLFRFTRYRNKTKKNIPYFSSAAAILWLTFFGLESSPHLSGSDFFFLEKLWKNLRISLFSLSGWYFLYALKYLLTQTIIAASIYAFYVCMCVCVCVYVCVCVCVCESICFAIFDWQSTKFTVSKFKRHNLYH